MGIRASVDALCRRGSNLMRARTREPMAPHYLCLKNTGATSKGFSFVYPHEQNFVAREFPNFLSYLFHLLLLSQSRVRSHSLAGHTYFAWRVGGARKGKVGGGKYVWCKRTGFCAQKECNYPNTSRNST